MNDKPVHLDEIDHMLLSELQADASLSQRELADRLGLSQNACWRRLGRLRETGILSESAERERADVAREMLLVRSMLQVLGLDPLSEQWGGGDEGAAAAHAALDTLVTDLLAMRGRARAERDWARADEIRDRLAAAGIVVEDSPTAARWHL